MADGDALAAMLHLPTTVAARPLAVPSTASRGRRTTPIFATAAAGLLRRGFPVLRLNLRGSARSLARSTSHYHLGRHEDLAEALAVLPEALTGQGVVLAGWSLGGALVLNLLTRDDESLPAILGAAAIARRWSRRRPMRRSTPTPCSAGRC
jgi:predicted alpha/beta-fold hydrolase